MQKKILKVTGIDRTRLANIIHKVHAGQAIEERRGGDRKSFRSILKKENVQNFIKQLQGSESHYNKS